MSKNLLKNVQVWHLLLVTIVMVTGWAATAGMVYQRFLNVEERVNDLRDVKERLGRIEGKLDAALK